MATVGSAEATNQFPELLERVAQGETIVITRAGQPVAMLVPPPRSAAGDVQSVASQMLAYRDQQQRKLGLSAREAIETGRRF